MPCGLRATTPLLVLVTAFSAIFISVEFSILIGVALVDSDVCSARRASAFVGIDGQQRPRSSRAPARRSALHCAASLRSGRRTVFWRSAGTGPLFESLEAAHRGRKHSLRRSAPEAHAQSRHGFAGTLRPFSARNGGARSNRAAVRRSSRIREGHGDVCAFRTGCRPTVSFQKKQQKFSATLKAVRHVYELLGENSCEHCRRNEMSTGSELKELYYLV